uniref:G_PROTEIN_RECEP_F2_4 domain-containing protein n=1 Tax=Panagrellus redivivus TaxID=6233 RepID=A0A7E4UVM2_PANRE
MGYIQLYAHDPGKLVICLISDAMPGYVERLWFYIGSTFSSFALLCYFVVWILLKMSKNTSTSKMFKSLVIICLIIGFCWIFVFSVFIFIGGTNLSIVDAWFIRYNLGVSLTFASCCNYYVLWFCSKDFRTAFKAPFSKWFNQSQFAANATAVKVQLSSSNKQVGLTKLSTN